MLIEGAVPEEFAGKSWEGYLHHVDFLVALMHVGTSLIPKSLIKVNGLVCFGWSVGGPGVDRTADWSVGLCSGGGLLFDWSVDGV